MQSKIIKSAKTESGVLSVKLTFSQSDLRLIRTPFGIQLVMKDCRLSGELGGPGFPSTTIRLSLPTLSSVIQVAANASKTICLNEKPELIAPVQLPRIIAANKNPKIKREKEGTKGKLQGKSSRKPTDKALGRLYPPPPFTPPVPELYEREKKTPRPLAQYVAMEYIGPVPVVVINVTPVHLRENGLLELSSEIEINVSYERSNMESPSTSNSAKSKSKTTKSISKTPFMHRINSQVQAHRLVDSARAKVLNPDDVWDFSPLFQVSITHVDYLIITDNQTWNEVTMLPGVSVGNMVQAFQRLADWKTKRGIKTRVVELGDIVAGEYGDFKSQARDLQEVIRNFLKWAYDSWGISWVVLGGDVEIIPVRLVACNNCSPFIPQLSDPPPNNRSYWAHTFLKMNVSKPEDFWLVPPDNPDLHLLVDPYSGRLIPYDANGTSGPNQVGWFYCTDNSYANRSQNPTIFIRVNGPEGDINKLLIWHYYWNIIPTDLYYSSLQGPNYDLPGLHDWDLNNNRVYGQYRWDGSDLDGVEYVADISVGRASVSTEAQANAFVNKIIAYEQYRTPNGSRLNLNWPSRMLLVSSNFSEIPLKIWPTQTSPPSDNQYFHPLGATYNLIKLEETPNELNWHLFAQITPTDLRLLPFDMNATNTGRGWYYAISNSNLSPNQQIIGNESIPIPTQWVVVYAQGSELTPQYYRFNDPNPDESMVEKEQLRIQIVGEEPRINSFSRLYEDEIDLSPQEAAAAPIDHLTVDKLKTSLNSGPHFVSFSGHGNSNGICWSEGQPYLSYNTAQILSNHHHTFIAYADSCLTNQFDQDAISEKLLYNSDGGAVAYVGYTRFGLMGVGSHFERAFFHCLTSTSHLGLLNDARLDLANELSKWTVFTQNLLGDPEMPVWIGKPKIMKVALSRTLDPQRRFVVEVYEGQNQGLIKFPVLGAVIHLEQRGFTKIAITDSEGKGRFDISHARPGILSVTVTKIGYLPYIHEVRIPAHD